MLLRELGGAKKEKTSVRWRQRKKEGGEEEGMGAAAAAASTASSNRFLKSIRVCTLSLFPYPTPVV